MTSRDSDFEGEGDEEHLLSAVHSTEPYTTFEVCSPGGARSMEMLNHDDFAVQSKLSEFEKGYKKPNSPQWTSFNMRTRKFYIQQNEHIESIRRLDSLSSTSDLTDHEERQRIQERHDKIVTYLSAVGNIILLVTLLIAFISSGAISIIASLVDSGLDNLSVLVILVTNRAKRYVDRQKYPQGKERLEPVGVMIFSCIMGTCSLLLIVESSRRLITDPNSPPDAGALPLSLVGADIVMKLVLYLICRRYANASVAAAALTQDHRNDLVLNTVAIFTTAIAGHSWAPLDPIGAILIAIWTGYSWGDTCLEQMRMLTGHAASPDFLRQLTYVCVQHDTRIQAVDTVRAFHFGTRFLVEIDVVLPPDMPLKEAHDIGEALQMKVEQLEDVERAFVHLDFETSHHPDSEHKQWGLTRS